VLLPDQSGNGLTVFLDFQHGSGPSLKVIIDGGNIRRAETTVLFMRAHSHGKTAMNLGGTYLKKPVLVAAILLGAFATAAQAETNTTKAAAPTTPERRWKEDLDCFARELPAKHKDFHRLMSKRPGEAESDYDRRARVAVSTARDWKGWRVGSRDATDAARASLFAE